MKFEKKKAVSFLMATIMLLSSFVFSTSVFAASTIEPLGTVSLTSIKPGYNLVRFKGGAFPDFLFDQIGYEKDGKTWPAYCIEPDKPGVGGGTSYSVDATTLLENPQVYGAIINGYPFKTPEQMGFSAGDTYGAYYVTNVKLA